MPKIRKTMSGERNACGAIKTMHAQTPIAHDKLKSFELFLSIKRRISGMLKRGNATAETIPSFSIHVSILPAPFLKYNTVLAEFHLIQALEPIAHFFLQILDLIVCERAVFLLVTECESEAASALRNVFTGELVEQRHLLQIG